jgi:hypothetical protein
MTFSTVVQRSPHLMALLDENNATYAPEYGTGLSNHAPMALIALAWLGATEDELTRFFMRYRTRLEPRTKDVVVKDALVANLMSSVLTNCAAESAAAAFHGLIRVRFAWHAGIASELAHACAYWSSCTSPLGALARSKEGTEPFDSCVRTLIDAGIERPDGASVRARHAALATDPRFTSIVQSLAPCAGDDDFTRLCVFARDLYAERDDFTSLHALTAAEATRTLATEMPFARQSLFRATAQGILACVVGGAYPKPYGFDDTNCLWPELARRSCASDDDHMAKLVVACWSLDRVCNDRSWRALAVSRIERGHV